MKKYYWSLLLFARVATALPAGETVTGGNVSFSRPSETELHVFQSSDRAIVEWQGFSIQEGELARIVQPHKDAVLLNRVVGSEISYIGGRLESNGQVYLINAQGITYGPNGYVDPVGFHASKIDLNDHSFMNGMIELKSGDIASLVHVEPQQEATRIQHIGEKIFLVGDDEPTTRTSNAGFTLLGQLFPASTLTVSSEKLIDKSTYAMQQLGSLMPERIWYQEFSILFFQEEFNHDLKKSKSKKNCYSLAKSNDYYANSTMSGDYVRLLDTYQQFLQSPFYRTPDMMNRIHCLEEQEICK